MNRWLGDDLIIPGMIDGMLDNQGANAEKYRNDCGGKEEEGGKPGIHAERVQNALGTSGIGANRGKANSFDVGESASLLDADYGVGTVEVGEEIRVAEGAGCGASLGGALIMGQM